MDDCYADSSVPDPAKVMQEVDEKKPRPGLFLILLSRCPGNMMEIVSAPVLIRLEQRREKEALVIGMAQGKENAIRLVRLIIEEMWETSGSFSLEEFLFKGRVRSSKG